MLNRFIFSIARAVIERRGQMTSAQVVFHDWRLVPEETGIVSPKGDFVEGVFGGYLHLLPNTVAILTSNAGVQQVFPKGGYIQIQRGRYTLEYVDLRERTIAVPINQAMTTDGFELSLKMSIIYKVTEANPLRILDVHQPVETLTSVCIASLKSYIRTHRHDDIISECADDHPQAESEITRFLIHQVNQNHACRAFTIMSATITECQGDPKILDIRKVRLLQERESQVERERLLRQKEIVDEQQDLERKKAEQDGKLLEMQAQFEANQQQILYNAKQLAVALENLRQLPQMQQEQYLKILDVKQKALETLIQAQAMPGFPRDIKETEIVNKIIQSMSDLKDLLPSPDVRVRAAPVNELSSTLINLIVPDKKKSSGENS